MRILFQRQHSCQSCSFQVLSLFINGLSPTTRVIRARGKYWKQYGFREGLRGKTRLFNTGKLLRASVEHDEIQEINQPRSLAQMESIVRQARQTFGDTLPQDFLSPEEYTIYERLYGPPSATTTPGDVDLLSGIEEDKLEVHGNALMKENDDGELEEIVYEDGEAEMDENAENVTRVDLDGSDAPEDFQDRMAKLKDTVAAERAQMEEDQDKAPQEAESRDINEEVEETHFEDREVDNEYVEDPEEEYERSDSTRTHPLTAAGRSGTSPSTIHLPRATFVDPITNILSEASNKQLAEVSLKIFGGPGLPTSTATVQKPNMKQQPISLDVSQSRMGEMEGNAFMATIMPGAYATILSTLVEVRKRLGPVWLRDLIQNPGGPRILDAGTGGAGVQAWREMLHTEWELMHPGKTAVGECVPHGKSTVVTGSAALRNRASHLLEDTTFIPRLPDYDPRRDHPSLEHSNPQPRKQYDIILAPHTLWPLKEDYMRKNQVQNFWSLLDPKGGVLILVEKGVPRGFELIASARETLLKYHISSPGAEEVATTIDDASESRFGPKEKGMIIAPCTNHGKCPMYITAGTSQGRKDFCHFSQRFIRPPFLQRILDSRDGNHEDISYSYVALQRGVDQREISNIQQGHSATEAAFSGYEDSNDIENPSTSPHTSESPPPFSNFSLPRAILPPIKRRGHVVLDLCTPAGKIERWTVPRSFSKQAYRDARKSQWGDLWALGAKTRVARNIRVGLKKVKTKTRNVENVSDEDELDELREIPLPREARPKFARKERKVRGMKKKKKKKKMEKMVLEDED